MARRERDVGMCAAEFKSGSSYSFAPEEWPRLEAAFTGSERYFKGQDVNGCTMVLKVMDLQAILLHTPESIANNRAERKANKAEDIAEGTDA